MKILVTGFEPFNKHPINPSQLLVQKLPTQHQDIILVKGILPVHHTLGPQKLLALLKDHQPDAVVAFGLATSRAKISLERVAINLMDYTIADNAGVTIANQPIEEHGPAAYFSTLPLEHLHSTLTEAGIPAEISLSAGAYLCNQVFYTLLHTLALENKHIPAGFIHLPALPEQAAIAKHAMPSLPLDLLLRATELILTTLSNPL